jgi:hypothetical protein
VTAPSDRRCQQAEDLVQPIEVEIGTEIVLDRSGHN